MVKVALFDDAPATLTCTVMAPEPPVRPAGTGAVSCVALTKVGGERCAIPLHLRSRRKPVPLTVRTNDGPPCMTDDGLRVVMEGGGVTENLLMAEVWLLVLTVTLTLAALAIIAVPI